MYTKRQLLYEGDYAKKSGKNLFTDANRQKPDFRFLIYTPKNMH